MSKEAEGLIDGGYQVKHNTKQGSMNALADARNNDIYTPNADSNFE